MVLVGFCISLYPFGHIVDVYRKEGAVNKMKIAFALILFLYSTTAISSKTLHCTDEAYVGIHGGEAGINQKGSFTVKIDNNTFKILLPHAQHDLVIYKKDIFAGMQTILAEKKDNTFSKFVAMYDEKINHVLFSYITLTFSGIRQASCKTLD